MPFVERPCPHCHAILRSTALTCWRCGFDLTHPEAGPAPPGEQAPRDVRPPENPEDLGPCPAGLFTRFFVPWMSRAELERSVRGHTLVPFLQSYYRLTALLVGYPVLRGATWWRSPSDNAFDALYFMRGSTFEFTGSPIVLAVGAVAWTIALVIVGAPLLLNPAVSRWLAALPLVALWVVLVLFEKGIRVALARRRYVERMSAGHLGEL